MCLKKHLWLKVELKIIDLVEAKINSISSICFLNQLRVVCDNTQMNINWISNVHTCSQIVIPPLLLCLILQNLTIVM